jgi:hypothetical protein
MNKKHIIGISGYARSGKDTLADALLNEFTFRNTVTCKFKFATALRQGLSRAFLEVDLPFSVDTEVDAEKTAIRPLMVEFGKFCRSRDKDIFAKKTIKAIEGYFRIGAQVAIVSDLRYANEGELLHECAKRNGWGYHHIDIERKGTFAANQEELDSIEALLDATYKESWFYGTSFSDRDISGINNWAAGIADNLVNNREHTK